MNKQEKINVINSILFTKKITGNEKLILIYLCNNDFKVSLKNLDIANFCKISPTSVSNCINHLYKLKILNLVSYNGRIRKLEIDLQYL